MSTVLTSHRPANQAGKPQQTDPCKKGRVYLEYDSTTPLGPRIVSADKEAERITGYSAEILQGQPIGLIYDPGSLDSFVDLLHSRVSQTDDFCWADKLLVKKGGKCSMHRWTFSPLRNGQGSVHGFAVTMEPLVESRNMADLKTSAKPDTKTDVSLDKAVDGFDDSRSESLALIAGGIAHDFKNVLQTIKSTLEMARITAENGSDTEGFIADAELALQDAVALAKQMLSFTIGYDSKTQTTHLDEMLEHVASISTMGTDVKYQVSIVNDLQPVMVDPRQIYQVFQNIIINGCQSMPDGGHIQLTARNVEIQNNEPGLNSGSYIAIGIRDRGCGISEANLAKIFSPDFTTKEDGTGVGLASCREIIKRHRGKIAVSSMENIGTEFVVYLPSVEVESVTKSERADGRTSTVSLNRVKSRIKPCLNRLAERCFAEPESPEEETLRARSGRIGGRVLIVDDQERVLTTAEKLLQFLGYETVSAASGEAALRIYREHLHSSDPIDAVLLDMTLPGGLSGNEVKREIRKVDENARIIATSGYFEDEHATASFLQEGWAGVLPKPYAIDALKKTVNDAILRN